MPIYHHKCGECGATVDDFRPMSRRHEKPKCEECGTPMERAIGGEFRRKRSPNYHTPIEMFSLAPNTPGEVKKLREAGAEFTPELVPIARNRAEKHRLMQAAGVVETN